jgi:Lon protease-like protein
MEIPLFPLHTVLCPGIALPLHVFEPRYRLMIERCVADDSPFGVVLIREGREVGGEDVSIAGIGTLAEIRQAERYPDGRYDLVVVGGRRFSIEGVEAHREPYLVAEVTPLDDEIGDAARAVQLASRSMRRFVDYLQLLQPLDGETGDEIDVRVEIETEGPPGTRDPGHARRGPGGSPAAEEPPLDIPTDDDEDRAADLDEARRLIIPDDPTVLSYLLAGIIQVDSVQRQALLEAATTEDRLAGLGALIERELWLLRRRLRHFAPDPAQAAVRRN